MIEAQLDMVMAWLSIWRPVQIAKLTADQQENLIDGYRLAISKMAMPEIERAKAACENFPENYIVEPGTFLRAGQRADAKEQFHLAVRAAGCLPVAWHTLPPRTFHAVIQLAKAGWDIKALNWEGTGKIWEEHYRAACHLDDVDPAALKRPPAAPQTALPHQRDQSAATRGCNAARAAVGLPPKIR